MTLAQPVAGSILSNPVPPRDSENKSYPPTYDIGRAVLHKSGRRRLGHTTLGRAAWFGARLLIEAMRIRHGTDLNPVFICILDAAAN